MRKNQISINITRYNDEVPASYPEKRQTINVYSDSNNLFEALSMAYTQAVNAIREWQSVAARTDIRTNVDNFLSGKLLGRRYSDNVKLQFVDERLKLNKDLLFYIENSQEILQVIKESRNKCEAMIKLTEYFNFTQEQISSIFRIRFDMFTFEEIEEIKTDMKKMEDIIEEREKRKNK